MTYTPHTVWVTEQSFQKQQHKPERNTPTCNAVWRKTGQHNSRDEFIVARKKAGDTFTLIALQAGLSITQTIRIYRRLESV